MSQGYGFAYMIGAQVLFFIVTITLIFWFVKNSKQKDIYTTQDILNMRLVSGEIDKNEFNSLLKIIINSKVKK